MFALLSMQRVQLTNKPVLAICMLQTHHFSNRRLLLLLLGHTQVARRVAASTHLQASQRLPHTRALLVSRIPRRRWQSSFQLHIRFRECSSQVRDRMMIARTQ